MKSFLILIILGLIAAVLTGLLVPILLESLR